MRYQIVAGQGCLILKMNEKDFYIEGCMIFDKPFVSDDGKLLAIHELWKIPANDDSCYHEYLSPYCVNYFSNTNAPDDFLDIQDVKFLEHLKKCEKLSLFFYYHIEMQKHSHTKFFNNKIYDRIIGDLKFIGYNVTSFEGSALTDGIYPIYLDNDIFGRVCHDERVNVPVNQFGLINKLSDCLKVCEINNINQKDDRAYWIPEKLYVDHYTYSIISQY